MVRRADPQRIYDAQREAVRQRLMGEGLPAESAERLVSSWEQEAARRGLEPGGRMWDAGWEWMAAQRRPATRGR
jgi:hypothetical protein